MAEKCDRCGNIGVDRRTIKMACFYDLEELKLPFGKSLVLHADVSMLQRAKPSDGIDLPSGQRINITPGTVTCSGEMTPEKLYTLRVCKRCRAEWMTAIQNWFNACPAGTDDDADNPEPKEGCGSGIFVRRNGINVEITEEEWYRLYGEASRKG